MTTATEIEHNNIICSRRVLKEMMCRYDSASRSDTASCNYNQITIEITSVDYSQRAICARGYSRLKGRFFAKYNE